MTITGTFKNIHNVDITVKIFNKANPYDNILYEISEHDLDDTHHFCFEADGVSIRHNYSDLFNPIITCEATINLITNIWVGDLLYANELGDIIVYIKKGNEIEFVGYVEPRTYSQPINMQKNTIEIHCLDWLMACGQFKLSSMLGLSYDYLVSHSSYETILHTLELCGLFNSRFIFPNEIIENNLLIDPVVEDIITKRIHTSLWLDDAEDQEKNLLEIITEICKYLNCRIVSPNGQINLILSNDAETTYSSMYNCSTGEDEEISIIAELPKNDISDEEVSMDDIYSQISVTCTLDTIDNVIEQPLEDEALESPYNNGQLYMTEYMSEPKSGVSTTNNEARFTFLVRYGRYHWGDPVYDYSCEGASLRNWYIRYVDNKNWHFANNFETLKNNQYVLEGNLYVREYFPMLDLNSNYCVAGSTEEAMSKGYINNDAGGWGVSGIPHTLPYQTMEIHPYIISIGKSDLLKWPDISPEKMPKYENYMIIPGPETWLSYNQSGFVTEYDAYNWINTQLQKYDPNSPNYGGTPLVSYKSSITMNLTPSDEATINYIVFTGQMKILPSIRHTSTTKEYTDKEGTYNYMGLSIEQSRPALLRLDDYYYHAGPASTRQSFIPLSSGTNRNEEPNRYYWQRYYTKKLPTQEEIYSAHQYGDTTYAYPEASFIMWGGYDYMDPDVGCPMMRNGMMWMPDVDSYAKQYLYQQTQISAYNPWTTNIPYCPILLCKMRIGDKYLRETTSQYSEKQRFEWSDDPTSTFTLGITLTRNEEHIIGENAKDIANNIDVNMNIGDTIGTAIPITKNDVLHGDVEFNIIGPFNSVIDSANGIYKCWPWFRQDLQTWGTNDVSFLNHIRGIQIEKFECTVQTNHAKNAALNNDGDLCYMSANTGLTTAELQDVTFDITTAVTEDEAYELGITTGLSYNNPINENNELYVVNSPNKQEEKYVNTLFNLYSTPKKIIEYEAAYTKEMTEMYRCVYPCTIMEHLDTPQFNTILTGNKLDLYYDRIQIQLREI